MTDPTFDSLASDTSLAIRLADADSRAWAQCQERYGARLRRAVSSVVCRFPGLSCSDTVDEVLGELWIRLLRHRGDKLRAFRAGRGLTLEQWLVRIAKQAAYDHVRKLRRRRTSVLDVEALFTSTDDPHATCLEREREDLLGSALAELPPRERQLFDLCIAGRTAPEHAAKEMGIAVATVYSKKHKLVARLSRVLDDSRALAA
ncbi:MAG: sigma-70 family RNA polymerase sigma factor [Polyangiaceae bacterium]|nr:sigma-70 family RNA polymerase sigma factor [Polyangiaceae bacterium]